MGAFLRTFLQEASNSLKILVVGPLDQHLADLRSRSDLKVKHIPHLADVEMDLVGFNRPTFIILGCGFAHLFQRPSGLAEWLVAMASRVIIVATSATYEALAQTLALPEKVVLNCLPDDQAGIALQVTQWVEAHGKLSGRTLAVAAASSG